MILGEQPNNQQPNHFKLLTVQFWPNMRRHIESWSDKISKIIALVKMNELTKEDHETHSLGKQNKK